MALASQFLKKLDQLWKRRTEELRSLVVPRGGGQPLRFTRERRDRLIDEALSFATSVLLKRQGHRAFNKVVNRRRLRQIKGRGVLDRAERLLDWARAKLRGPIVYAFWRKRKCLYVGKGNSWKRLRHYARSIYIREATCIEVFQIAGKSQLAKAECLATHLFRPRDNINMAAEVRWGKVCPICERHDQIRAELKTIFKMK